jgi:hypothetical protein
VARSRHRVVDRDLAGREATHQAAKQRIGRACFELLQDGDSVFLDSGTTVASIARAVVAAHLASGPRVRNLSVLTSALDVARARGAARTLWAVLRAADVVMPWRVSLPANAFALRGRPAIIPGNRYRVGPVAQLTAEGSRGWATSCCTSAPSRGGSWMHRLEHRRGGIQMYDPGGQHQMCCTWEIHRLTHVAFNATSLNRLRPTRSEAQTTAAACHHQGPDLRIRQ